MGAILISPTGKTFTLQLNPNQFQYTIESKIQTIQCVESVHYQRLGSHISAFSIAAQAVNYPEAYEKALFDFITEWMNNSADPYGERNAGRFYYPEKKIDFQCYCVGFQETKKVNSVVKDYAIAFEIQEDNGEYDKVELEASTMEHLAKEVGKYNEKYGSAEGDISYTDTGFFGQSERGGGGM